MECELCKGRFGSYAYEDHWAACKERTEKEKEQKIIDSLERAWEKNR